MTKDEYEKSIKNIYGIEFGKQYSEPKYECEKCGGGMCKDLTKVLATYPAKYEYVCNKCGHVDYLYGQ